MRKTLAVVIAFLFTCAMHMPAYADVGSDVAALKDQVQELRKQNREIDDLRGLVDQLSRRIDELQNENASTRDYARSLEKQLQQVAEVPAPTAPAAVLGGRVESASTRGASSSTRTFLSDLGNLQIGLEATALIQHIESSEGSEDELASGSLNVYMQMPIAEDAVFHLNLEGIGGDEDDNFTSVAGLNHDSGSLQDTDGVDRIQIREAKVEARFLDDKLLTYVGKIDPAAYFDGNEAANDENSQFVASAFANNATFLAVTEGVYVAGVGGAYDLSEYLDGLSVQSAFFTRDNDGEHILDNPMIIGEIDYATELFDLPGNYRVYGYLAANEAQPQAGGFDDNAWDDDLNVGFGFSVDQKISERIMLFGRYGYNGNDLAAGHYVMGGMGRTALPDQSLSFGFQVENPLLEVGMDAPDDVLGMGFAAVSLYDTPLDTSERMSETEYLIETYYKHQLNRQISVSPFVQFVKHVGGDKNREITSIFGLRSSVEF